MIKKTVVCGVLLSLMLLASLAGQAEGTPFHDAATEWAVTFPEGWTVVTPATVSEHFRFFTEATPELAADTLRADGVVAVAFSPEGDASLRMIAREGDEAAALYYDVERYTADMRNSIKDDFLDKDAWALTGYRYTAAAWKNREGQGRVLELAYTIKEGEETVARGLQAYTVHGGRELTIDMCARGRKLTTEEERLFATFVDGSVWPGMEGAPLLPTGLTITSVIPEETDKQTFSIRGESMKGASVRAFVIPDQGDSIPIGETKAGSGGVFKLEVTLPGQGEWRLYIRADMEGHSHSEGAYWVDYDPRRLPVTFTSYPTGDVYDSQVIISGKTIAGVKIQCMEGDKNLTKTTGSDGSFSFKLDRTITGDRTVVLSLSKKGYVNRRFDVTFNRQWTQEDYVKHLAGQVQSLSFENLQTKAEKYLGRLVCYKGTVLSVSSAGERVYVQLGIKQNKDGDWYERIIAVTDGMEVLLGEGDSASLYIEVTGESYAFSEVSLEGDPVDIDLPSVRLLTYEKHE